MSEVKIPEGYKQTEVGVIPEDWDSIKVQDVCDFIVPGRNKPQKFDGDIPWITTPDLIDGRAVFFSRSGLKISKEVAKTVGSKIVPAGSVIMSCVGELGLVAIAGVNIVINQQLHAFLPSKKIDNYFLMYALKDQESYFHGAATKTALPYLNKDNCNATPLSLPSIQEQTAIATALSDVDNLIQSLEKLVAKKEAIKTGTMQQLLTGKTRLPEFATGEDGSPKGFKQTELGRIPEDWEHKTLFEMTENKGLVRGPFGGALKKDSFVRIGFKVYEQRNAIYANTEIGKYYINKDKFNELHRFTVKPYDFIVSCSGTIGRIYQIPVNAPEGIINQALLKITLNKNTDEQFFYQVFNSKEFQESITDSTQGGAMKNLIGMSEFKKSIMLMPSKSEQTAIATILLDMDTEIQALQQRLEKTKDIKQGMMQQLLTGKVRLLDSSTKSDTQTLDSKGELQA